MAGFQNPDPVVKTVDRDRTSVALRGVAVAAGVVASAHGAAAVALLIKNVQAPLTTHMAPTELWLCGGAVGFGVIAAAAAVLSRVSTALFELDLDQQQRGLFARSDRRADPAEVARQLTNRSSALGLTEFHDPPAPMRTPEVAPAGGRHSSQAPASARHK